MAGGYLMAQALDGCRLKLRRANEHLEALDREIETFLRRNPYAAVDQFNPESMQSVIWMAVREDPPFRWSAIIGDVVHNLRSMLDHLAWQLVIKAGNKPDPGRTAYPVFHRNPFDPATPNVKSELARWNQRVSGMDDADIALIKTTQPYERGDAFRDHPLYVLNELSNWDKHRELHLCGSVLQGSTFHIKETRNARWGLLESRPFGPFVDKTVVAVYQIMPTVADDFDVKMNVRVSFGVAFAEGNPAAGRGVRETLHGVRNYVRDILSVFDSRFS
jgi:hypothetical protein